MPDSLYENQFTGDGPVYALFSGTDLGAFASGIYNELMVDTNAPFSISYISGWLENHIGELNVSCQTNFNTVSGFCIPPLSESEVSIYQELFTVYYYKRNAMNMLGAAQYSADWTTLSEADSRIVKVSRNDIAKTYRNFALDAENRLKYMIAQYRMTQGQPLSVTGDDAIAYRGLTDSIFPYYGFYFVRGSSYSVGY